MAKIVPRRSPAAPCGATGEGSARPRPRSSASCRHSRNACGVQGFRAAASTSPRSDAAGNAPSLVRTLAAITTAFAKCSRLIRSRPARPFWAAQGAPSPRALRRCSSNPAERPVPQNVSRTRPSAARSFGSMRFRTALASSSVQATLVVEAPAASSVLCTRDSSLQAATKQSSKSASKERTSLSEVFRRNLRKPQVRSQKNVANWTYDVRRPCIPSCSRSTCVDTSAAMSLHCTTALVMTSVGGGTIRQRAAESGSRPSGAAAVLSGWLRRRSEHCRAAGYTSRDFRRRVERGASPVGPRPRWRLQPFRSSGRVSGSRRRPVCVPLRRHCQPRPPKPGRCAYRARRSAPWQLPTRGPPLNAELRTKMRGKSEEA
eukprot:scaffold2724_cov260-Pinguiococcus_pyrenoidosus.AAC.29